MRTGELIRKVREERRLTQQEFGGLIGVSVHTVIRWEKGKNSPTVDDIKKIASTLGVSVVYLMGDMADEDSPKECGEHSNFAHRPRNFAIERTINNIKTRVEIPIEATPEQVRCFVDIAGIEGFRQSARADTISKIADKMTDDQLERTLILLTKEA